MTVDRGALGDLTGRNALVTGAGGWLGAPMARALAEAGAHVWVTGRREAPLTAVVKGIRAAGGTATAAQLDITRPEQLDAVVSRIESREGRLDILVNNAHAGGPRDETTQDPGFAHAAGAANTAVWVTIQRCLDALDAAVTHHGDAAIINVSSMYGKVSPDPRVYQQSDQPQNPLFYGASKAGLLQMTRWLACDLGPRGIRVNSISPGPFPQRDLPDRDPHFVRLLAAKVPLGRTGRPEEIGGAVVFLAGSGASYITGADIAIDGGWTAW